MYCLSANTKKAHHYSITRVKSYAQLTKLDLKQKTSDDSAIVLLLPLQSNVTKPISDTESEETFLSHPIRVVGTKMGCLSSITAPSFLYSPWTSGESHCHFLCSAILIYN